MGALHLVDNGDAQAQAYAGLGDHQWPYGQLSMVLDKARRNGTPHQPKHCGCQACAHGFTHVAGVVR